MFFFKQSDSPDTENEFEYSDLKAMTCLLCSRQFKSMDQLKRHNKESDLHKVRPLRLGRVNSKQSFRAPLLAQSKGFEPSAGRTPEGECSKRKGADTRCGRCPVEANDTV